MRNRAQLDLRTDGLIDELLDQAGQRLDTHLDAETLRFGGEDGATCGAASNRHTWVRLQHRRRNEQIPARWDAEETAAAISGVRKPTWHRAVTWDDPPRGVRWRADELDLVLSPVISGLTTPPAQVPDSDWWQDIKHSLHALSHQSTARIAVSQAELDQTIATLDGFNDLDTRVDEWSAAHGDLCWPNLTEDGQLLDWEAWGQAPRGYDAATLWGLSLPHPKLAQAVRKTFTGDLESRSGQLAQLMWCASARRAVSTRAELAHYREPIHTAAQQLHHALTG